MIEKTRLRAARQLHGWTAKFVADKAGVSPGRISQIERGLGATPSDQLVTRLAMVLQVPKRFLTDTAPLEGRDLNFHYRHRARTSARLQHRVEQEHHLFSEFLAHIRSFFVNWPKADVPNWPRPAVGGLEHAERSAAMLRRHWGLPLDVPIPNLSALLESKGIWLRVLNQTSADVDGFSVWDDDGNAHVALNRTHGSAYRDRLDQAHELFHLIAHRDLVTGSRDLEAEAFRFAGAFLVPRGWFLARAPKTTNPAAYASLSKATGVSIAALIRRSFDLGVLTPKLYRSAMIRLSSSGARKDESSLLGFTPEFEPTHLLPTHLAILSDRGHSIDQLAADLYYPSALLRRVLGDLPSDSRPPTRRRGVPSAAAEVVDLGAFRERRTLRRA